MKQQVGLVMFVLLLSLPLCVLQVETQTPSKSPIKSSKPTSAVLKPSLSSPDVTHHEKIDQIASNVETLLKQDFWRNFAAAAAPVVTLIIGAASIWFAGYTLKQNMKLGMLTLRQKANEEEAKAIRQKLDEFYSPLIHLLGVTKRMYSSFVARRTEEDRTLYVSKQGRFSTLVALIKGKQFEGVDAVLLQEIMEVGKKSEALISSKLGLVEDRSLRELLWKVGAHYRLIDLALQRKLEGATTEFDEFTFPAEIDERLAEKEKQLQDRLKTLQKVPDPV